MVRASELSSAATPTASGVNPAKVYFVTKLSDTTFKLNEGSQSGTSVDLNGTGGSDDMLTKLVFTKQQKTMNFHPHQEKRFRRRQRRRKPSTIADDPRTKSSTGSSK